MPGNPYWCPLSSAVLVGPSNEMIENSMVRKLRRLGKVRTKRTTRTKRNTRKTRRKDLNKEAYSISWHILAYLDICKVSQYLSIFLNISQAPLPMMWYFAMLLLDHSIQTCYTVQTKFQILCDVHWQLQNPGHMGCKSRLTWRYLKNIEPAALLSASQRCCSPLQPSCALAMRRTSKMFQVLLGPKRKSQPCPSMFTNSSTVNHASANVTDAHNLPWLGTWNGLVICWS